MNIDEDLIVRAVCMKMGDAIVIFAYQGEPKMGAMVMKPYSQFPDPPLILFEGRNVETSIALANLLSGLLKRGVFVSSNLDPSKVPIQTLAKDLSRFIIDNFDF
ncbi:MAG: hypothetical protein D6732_05985 [Methanobacteriota archaeon]|nr:MAG: hypothetical protein D6732_05985 [Euryarchaeota archaeon]